MSIDYNTDDFMRLAPGVGVIPEKYRNRGYEKLPFAPGEGGIGNLLHENDGPAAAGDMRQFLAAVASGADPQQFAQNLLNTDTPARRRGRKEAVNG